MAAIWPAALRREKIYTADRGRRVRRERSAPAYDG